MPYPPLEPWRELADYEMATFSADEALAYEMGALAARAKSDAERHHHINLDFSPDSVELLEYRILSAIFGSLFPTTFQRLMGRRSRRPTNCGSWRCPGARISAR